MRAQMVLSIVLSMVLVIPSVFAGVWVENFDQDAGNWEVVSGTWQVKDGAYDQSEMAAAYQKSVLQIDDLTDFVLDVDVTVLESSAASSSVAAGVLVRCNADASSGYRIWGRPDQHGFQASIWQDNNFQHLQTDANFKAVEGETFHLKVEIQGFVISAWFNDDLVIDELEDESRSFESGKIAFINYNAHCQYDNLMIEGPGVQTNTAVDATGKTTVIWAKLKS